jgi:CP family cyanate transporter-like MFS transporter
MAVTASRRAAAPAGVLVAILAAAFNMRVGVVEVGPVIEDIRDDTGMSSALAGVLTTMIFVCQALFSLVGVALVRRYGAERLIILSLVSMCVGTALRGVLPSALLLILATLPIGIGIALIAIALPGVVKEHYAERAGAITGAYVASLSVAAAVTALGVVPLSDALGGWRWAFLLSAVATLPALALWLPRRGGVAPQSGSGPVPTLRPSRTGLLLGLLFGAQSICFSSMITWVAAVFIDNGWDRADAALATAVIPLTTIVVALLVPRISDRGGRMGWIMAMAATMSVGLLGIAFWPQTASLVWVVLFGIGNGAIFPMLLTLPLDLRASPAEVTGLTAWMQALGYALTALGPVMVGAMRDATGGFRAPFAVCSALSLSCIALTAVVKRDARRR